MRAKRDRRTRQATLALAIALIAVLFTACGTRVDSASEPQDGPVPSSLAPECQAPTGVGELAIRINALEDMKNQAAAIVSVEPRSDYMYVRQLEKPRIFVEGIEAVVIESIKGAFIAGQAVKVHRSLVGATLEEARERARCFQNGDVKLEQGRRYVLALRQTPLGEWFVLGAGTGVIAFEAKDGKLLATTACVFEDDCLPFPSSVQGQSYDDIVSALRG